MAAPVRLRQSPVFARCAADAYRLAESELLLRNIEPAFFVLTTYYGHEVVQHTRRALEEFRDLTQAHQLDAAVLVIPDKDQVYKEFASDDDRRRPNQVLT